MKKAIILGIIIMILSCCSCGSGSAHPNEEMKDIPITADYMNFDYDELKAYASLIVKVKVMDELSEENTVVQQDPDDKYGGKGNKDSL